jgi:CRISPR-associated protein Csb1
MKLTLEVLTEAARRAAALRSITRLQPVGGKGDRVFPATFDQGKYATEKRRLVVDDKGSEVDCALPDSVASQANRAEEALLAGIRSGHHKLPLIEVSLEEAKADFLADIPMLTSLEVPHRLADAILRDSQLPDGTRFASSTYAEKWRKASPWNARAVYELCPTALLLGMWDSPEKPGGLGAKFERASASEIMAVDITKSSDLKGYRIDPISASKTVIMER